MNWIIIACLANLAAEVLLLVLVIIGFVWMAVFPISYEMENFVVWFADAACAIAACVNTPLAFFLFLLTLI